MKYDTRHDEQAQAAADYVIKLIDQKAIVEVKKVSTKRSLSQNSYLHLLLSICGIEWGYSLAEIKINWKRDIAPSIFAYEKNDQWFVRSSARLDSAEMTKAIDLLKKYAAEQGLILPDANEQEKLMYYENLIEQSQYI